MKKFVSITLLAITLLMGVSAGELGQVLAQTPQIEEIPQKSVLHYEEYPTIRLRSLDKITARTLTFDAQVGSVIKFGDIYIKILTCRKPPPVEKTEAAAFLQIWQVDKVKDQSRWIFSGWMFASSPALSGMDHPVYDVWVIDCLGKDPEEVPPIEETGDKPLPDEGEVKADQVQEPEGQPQAEIRDETDTSLDDAKTENGNGAFKDVLDDLTGESNSDAPATQENPSQEIESSPDTDSPPEKNSSGSGFNGIY
ncbi:MAG: DUF2155 domain-containing protein [Alphaproteobacteria bacterium]|nr:DUF2155 domain-containing protein [Alphaproteobacteria bacterium]